MHPLRDPVLHATPIEKLRPTQMTLGLREVERKRKSWKDKQSKEMEAFFGTHLVPVVLGPDEQIFLTDHHHLVRALHEEQVRSIFTVVLADWSRLNMNSFWNMMTFNRYVHPYDSNGKRRSFEELPKSITELTDDPYRSLAGALLNQGGYAKDMTPFSEFMWADFLRIWIKPKAIEKDFDKALQKSLELAKSEEAAYLPGWCASHSHHDKKKSDKKKQKDNGKNKNKA